jgi:hypothetical protein
MSSRSFCAVVCALSVAVFLVVPPAAAHDAGFAAQIHGGFGFGHRGRDHGNRDNRIANALREQAVALSLSRPFALAGEAILYSGFYGEGSAAYLDLGGRIERLGRWRVEYCRSHPEDCTDQPAMLVQGGE